jgi:hypothetical protein
MTNRWPIKLEMKKGDHNKHQGKLGNYFENLHSNKLENLEEMDKFLDTYDHTKLNQIT